MSWWIKGVRCSGFRHYFLQCDTVSVMCFSLICGVQYYRFKVSKVFTFMKGEVLISIIGDKNVDRCLVLGLVNAINHVNVGVSTLGVLSSMIKCALCVVMSGPLILIGTKPLCLGGILRVDFTVPIVAFWVLVCVKVKNSPLHCI